MFDETDETPPERPQNPADRAREKSDELRMHAQFAAVYEGTRKFDARIIPGLDPDLARDIQRTMARLEKAKIAETPVIADESTSEAARLLDLPSTQELSTNDYHVYQRPGEVMMVRWIAGDEVDAFYERLQAHVDAGLEGFRDDERQASEWKGEQETAAFLEALDRVQVRMEEIYLRGPIREHGLYVLSTQSADELDILYLSDYVMSVPVEEIVGGVSALPETPTEHDRAWFFKLFSLRGVKEGVEQMCFFTFLQKTDDSW